MSSDDEYQKLLATSTLIGLIGSLLLIVGMIFDIISVGVKVLDLWILAWVVGILLVNLLTFLGAATKYGLVINDERPSLLVTALFIFAPTLLISDANTPMFYLLKLGNESIGTGSAGFMNYLGIAGMAILLITFFIQTWIFLWKNRLAFTRDTYFEGSEIAFVRIVRVITGILATVAGVGIILGMVIAPSASTSSLLMFEDGSQIDLTALAFIFFIVGTVITALVMLLSNFGILKTPKTELPLLALLLAIIVMPGYAPPSASLSTWSTPIYKLLHFGQGILGDITFMGWILIISVLSLILAFMIGIITFFIKTSAAFEARPTVRRRRARIPKRQPPAAIEDIKPATGSLADQLASSQTQPPATAEQPSTPGFMPSTPPSGTAAPAADKPICPFCGKGLRFIDEYQRWYCDSCQQYV
ncbi:MAG: hypothetical protein GPJ52_14710 [Candidatus Heimdallarchaeota archaeon]|nr:hypothetical protein [Candidatus Heimdallarchaeota archaeon]